MYLMWVALQALSYLEHLLNLGPSYMIMISGSGLLSISIAFNALSQHSLCTVVFVIIGTIIVRRPNQVERDCIDTLASPSRSPSLRPFRRSRRSLYSAGPDSCRSSLPS